MFLRGLLGLHNLHPSLLGIWTEGGYRPAIKLIFHKTVFGYVPSNFFLLTLFSGKSLYLRWRMMGVLQSTSLYVSMFITRGMSMMGLLILSMYKDPSSNIGLFVDTFFLLTLFSGLWNTLLSGWLVNTMMDLVWKYGRSSWGYDEGVGKFLHVLVSCFCVIQYMTDVVYWIMYVFLFFNQGCADRSGCCCQVYC